MSKTERLRGPALDVCPGCGLEYTRYSQHWAKNSDCNYPAISDETQALLQGLLLADGSVGGNPDGRAKIRITTANRDLAAWIYDELGWLASELDHYERENGDEYRVSTHAHPALNRYRDWYIDSVKRPPEGFRFSPRSARAFYACDGHLNFGTSEDPRVELRYADDIYADRLETALSETGAAVTRSSDRLRIGADDVPAWLEWIGDPVPGAEHKWESNLSKYQSRQQSSL